MTSKDSPGILPREAAGIGSGGAALAAALALGKALALALGRALAVALATATASPSLPLLRPVRQPSLAHLQWLAHRSSLHRGSRLQRPCMEHALPPEPRTQGSPRYGTQKYGPGMATQTTMATEVESMQRVLPNATQHNPTNRSSKHGYGDASLTGWNYTRAKT